MLAPHPKLRIVSPYRTISISVYSHWLVTAIALPDSYISGFGAAVGLAVATAVVVGGKVIALHKLVSW